MILNSFIYSSTALPALLCFNIDRLQIRAMQTEIETLQSVIENLKTEIDTGGDMEVTTSTKKKVICQTYNVIMFNSVIEIFTYL